jgi:hypothetical protein
MVVNSLSVLFCVYPSDLHLESMTAPRGMEMNAAHLRVLACHDDFFHHGIRIAACALDGPLEILVLHHAAGIRNPPPRVVIGERRLDLFGRVIVRSLSR